MGDRVLITFRSGDADTGHSYSPVIYLHWGGGDALDWLQRASHRMRAGDESYSAARTCGFFHEKIDGNLSLGLINAPRDIGSPDFNWSDFSHGDTGVVVVDVGNGDVLAAGGYLHRGPTLKKISTLSALAHRMSAVAP